MFQPSEEWKWSGRDQWDTEGYVGMLIRKEQLSLHWILQNKWKFNRLHLDLTYQISPKLKNIVFTQMQDEVSS